MVTGAATPPPHTPPRKSENRRSNKPIMEKRRRARINNCLNQLKCLILDQTNKDPARHNKLEKADILEMTVKHVERMRRQETTLAAAADPEAVDKFRAGFRECAGEVGRFPGLEPPVRKRLLHHLAACLSTADDRPLERGVLLPAGQLQVVPTRLPNGDIALVLPRPPASPPPLTVLAPSPPSTPPLSPPSGRRSASPHGDTASRREDVWRPWF